jgi:hypothetical protein
VAFFWQRRPSPKPWTWKDRRTNFKLFFSRKKLRSLFRWTNLRSFFGAKSWKSFFAKKNWEKFFVGFALSIVVGLVAAIASAQLVQWRWFRDDTGYTDCRSVAVAQATKAVHDLSDTSTTSVTVGSLADTALAVGSERIENTQLGDAFYRAYDDAVGECRAEDTFEDLWGVGITAFVLALLWWNFKYIKSPVNGKN